MPEINQDIQLQDDPNIQGGDATGDNIQALIVENEIYKATDFDLEKASNKQLCAVVTTGLSPSIIGTGVAFRNNLNELSITVDGATYTFDTNGEPLSKNASKFKLMMGESKVKALVDTNIGTTKKAYTRSVTTEGEIEYKEETSPTDISIPIDNLNARDQFAIQALRGMLDKIPDPSAVGKDEVTHYCEAAYFWASYMMKASSNSRAIIKDDPEQSGTQAQEPVILESGTDKLLNNIQVAIERTAEAATATGATTYSERIINPKLNEWLAAFVSDGQQGTVNLKSLIDAIGQGGGGTGGTVQIGDEGLGRDRANPFYISNSDESKYTPYAIYQYRNKGEAESDGWDFDSQNNVWKKAYYNDVPGSYTDESAKTLPTWKNVVKVSIVEMADLIDAIHDVADAIRNQ